jgi:hypothetical protein
MRENQDANEISPVLARDWRSESGLNKSGNRINSLSSELRYGFKDVLPLRYNAGVSGIGERAI